MPKPKSTPSVPTKAPAKSAPAPPVQSHAIRETVESVVIALVLAFLFRTFEAEAFVIPTGSMAPTLQGGHKDVECPQCQDGYPASASNKVDEGVQRLQQELASPTISPQRREELERQIRDREVVAVTCP